MKKTVKIWETWSGPIVKTYTWQKIWHLLIWYDLMIHFSFGVIWSYYQIILYTYKHTITLLHADPIIIVFLWLFGRWEIMRDCRTSLDYIRPLTRLQPGFNFILDLPWQFINHRWVNFINVVTPCFPSSSILISTVTATIHWVLLCQLNFIKFCKAMTSWLKTCTKILNIQRTKL